MARLSYFKAVGIPSALGLLVVVAGALSTAPAVVAAASRFGLLDPRRMIKTREWRRTGTATVRWPGPVSAAPLAIAIVGVLIMPSMKVNYNDRYYTPGHLPSGVGYAAAERHFSAATMNPDILMVESDHGMRNSAHLEYLWFRFEHREQAGDDILGCNKPPALAQPRCSQNRPRI